MERFYRPRLGRRQAITPPALATVHRLATVTEPRPDISSSDLTAHDRLSAPEPQPRRRLWPWAIAAVFHILVLGLLIWASRHRPQPEALEPTGVSVVYDAGSTTQQSPRQAQIPAPAETPAPPPPPPPQVAQTQPEVNLNMPDDVTPPQPAPLMPLPPTLLPRSQPLARSQPRAAQRAAPRHSPQHYMVLNNPSFGNASPLSPTGQKGLNLSLPQSDAQAALAPDVTIQGDVGADWNAGFNKWVYAHLYYPTAAAEQGQQGTVTVQFTAHRDGHVTGLRMTDGSGSTFLDQAWTGIFAQNTLPPFPPGSPDSVKITATVRYELLP